MHNTLDGLPERVLLDTNVLLDAAFVDGLARRAVAALAALRYKPIVDCASYRDGERILADASESLNLAIDTDRMFKSFIKEVSVELLARAPAVPVGRVNRADKHVVEAALHYGAWVLTGDAPLIVECRTAGIQGRLPWDVLLQAEAAAGKPMSLHHIFRVAPLNGTAGSIFARVLPGSWAGRTSAGEYAICDIEGIGCLYYDTRRGEWIFELRSGPVVAIKKQLGERESWAVCATYSLPATAKRGRIALMVGSSQTEPARVSTNTLKGLAHLTSRRIQVGSMLNGARNWNGHMRALVVGPQPVNAETWKAIISIPEAAPNPYDANALRHSLWTLDKFLRYFGTVVLPTEKQLFQAR